MTIGFGMFVRPSARMEKLGSHWTNFYEVSYLIIFQKSLVKIKVLSKSEKDNWYFT